MVFLSVALHRQFLQFFAIEELSQISSSYLEALDFWPSHDKETQIGRRCAYFGNF
jgi:hypothetical protein